MIKAKALKNIMRNGTVVLGIMLPVTVTQIVTAALALVLAVLEIYFLRTRMEINSVMSIVFVTIFVFVSIGIVKIQGMSLVKLLYLTIFKAVDKRPYQSKGVFDKDDDEQIF
ncbi:hypothetical protein FACS1894133_2320 [Clostridia bacterium]|nr:hypothetical protein FACS1894133_2320 [Clostridia bacterium]